MQSLATRKNTKTKNKRIKRKKIRRIMFFVICMACIAGFVSIMVKKNHSNNAQKIEQKQLSEGVYENEKKPVKDDTNVVKAEGTTNSQSKIENNNDVQANSQEKVTVNSQAVNVEQALVDDGKKTAYLTFDDGPSVTVTPQILDVLKSYKINGTFFVLGSNVEADEESKEILKRTFQEGNAIGNHTYTHNLKKLYPHNKVNVDYFMQEVDKTNNALKSVFGQDFNTRAVRMPGGYMSRKYYNDPNLALFDSKLKEKNMCSIDWNAYDADAEGKKKNSQQLLNEVKVSVGSQNKVVILMHDTYGKEETAKALPKIIEYLKEQGYEFKTLK